MKINARILCSYLAKPYEGSALLIYGPHALLNESLARAIVYKTSTIKGISHTSLATCTKTDLSNCLAPQPSLLENNNEIRIPLVFEIKDSDTPTVMNALPLAQGAKTPLVLAASSLNTRSKLVRAINESEATHAAGVYESTPEMRGQLLAIFSEHHKLRIPSKICAFIAGHTNEDSNLEDLAHKVGLLVHDKTDVLPSQIISLIGSLSVEVDNLIWAFLEKSSDRFNKLDLFLKNGESVITFIRHTLRILKQMIEVRTKFEDGTSLDAAVSSLRPAPLFTIRKRFESFCRNHTSQQLVKLINSLNQLETQSKLNAGLVETSTCEIFTRAA